MDATLARVIDIVASHSGIPAAKLTATSAIDQDVKISGDDVHELVEALVKEFGEQLWKWPWQRFAELSESGVFTFLYFIWRVLTWPFRGRLFDPSCFERMELGYITVVINRGTWFEP